MNTILITGANNGIGLAMSQTLLLDSYNVAALDLSTEKLDSLCVAYPKQLSAYACDVSQADQVRSAVEAVIQKWKRIDSVVNKTEQMCFNTPGNYTS